MQKLWLDLETYSETPIKNGVHAYAENVEILLFAWAIDDEPVAVWDTTAVARMPFAFIDVSFECPRNLGTKLAL